jgi:type II secretory pathway pseudopilin PulG
VIELLTVVGIVALLVAILTPVFARAREQAQIGVSITNVSQLTKALLLYSADNDDRSPLVVSDFVVAGLARGDLPGTRPPSDFDYVVGQLTIRQALDTYLRSQGVWRSPLDRDPGAALPGSSTTFFDYAGTSYGYLVLELCGGSLSQLSQPSESAFFRDGMPFVRERAVTSRSDGSVRFLPWMEASRQLETTERAFGCR